MTLAALALEYRAGDPQTPVDVDREDVDVGENFTSGVRLNADWRA
ncbi:hypothetical protein [Rhodococcus sp. ZPP]|nr:hypothetical protein [Rhodococcus sp. ZPP]